MFKFLIFPIYLDYSSTTPVDPRIVEKILPYYYYKFGNFSSRNHILGWQSEYIIEQSRKKIAFNLNCNSKELIFTSCATESNNLAIKGISFFYKTKGNHIITINTEHKSIIKSCEYLLSYGYNITYLNVNSNGLINIKNLLNFIKNNTILISIMFVNNEIGVIQNIKNISNICKIKKIILHVDASQAIGKIEINLNILKIDLLSLSSHKSYGPKGIGGLYIRRKSNLYFNALIDGGGQEKNLRSGTLPTHQIVGMGENYYLLKFEFLFENYKIKNYKNILLLELLKIDSIYINGDLKYRIPNNLNISFDFIEGESIILSMKNIAISTGSACASKNLEPSYILKSLNKFYSIIHSSLRISIGKYNKLCDLYYILKKFFKKIIYLRNLSPIYGL